MSHKETYITMIVDNSVEPTGPSDNTDTISKVELNENSIHKDKSLFSKIHRG